MTRRDEEGGESARFLAPLQHRPRAPERQAGAANAGELACDGSPGEDGLREVSATGGGPDRFPLARRPLPCGMGRARSLLSVIAPVCAKSEAVGLEDVPALWTRNRAVGPGRPLRRYRSGAPPASPEHPLMGSVNLPPPCAGSHSRCKRTLTLGYNASTRRRGAQMAPTAGISGATGR
jgi:hypothetical protein